MLAKTMSAVREREETPEALNAAWQRRFVDPVKNIGGCVLVQLWMNRIIWLLLLVAVCALHKLSSFFSLTAARIG